MSDLVTLRVFYDLPQAQIARSLLSANGIPAFLPDGCMAANNWHLIVALGGLRLEVPEPNLDRARSLLEASFPLGEEGDPTDICPSCRAQEVFRQPSWIAAALGFLLGHVPFLMMTRRRRCRACGHRWRTSD